MKGMLMGMIIGLSLSTIANEDMPHTSGNFETIRQEMDSVNQNFNATIQELQRNMNE